MVLNYTLILDSAPGPHVDEEGLLLTVKPNPVIVEVEEDSRTYISGSEDTITIIVRVCKQTYRIAGNFWRGF